jgi:hypothetical protein
MPYAAAGHVYGVTRTRSFTESRKRVLTPEAMPAEIILRINADVLRILRTVPVLILIPEQDIASKSQMVIYMSSPNFKLLGFSLEWIIQKLVRDRKETGANAATV